MIIQFFSEYIYCLILTKVKPLAESEEREEKHRNIEQRGETVKRFSESEKLCRISEQLSDPLKSVVMNLKWN